MIIKIIEGKVDIIKNKLWPLIRIGFSVDLKTKKTNKISVVRMRNTQNLANIDIEFSN